MPKSRSRRRPPPRRTAPRRTGRPAPSVPPPTATGLRGAVERRSAPVLVWLSARPRLLLPLASLALLIGGFVAPPRVGVPLLVVLFGIVGWLTYLSWPALERGGRLLRAAVLGLLVVAVVTTLAG